LGGGAADAAASAAAYCGMIFTENRSPSSMRFDQEKFFSREPPPSLLSAFGMGRTEKRW
jgi:hypothetical protein